MKFSRYNVIGQTAAGDYFAANTITGAIAKLTAEEYGLFARGDAAAVSADDLPAYRQCGFAVADELDESALLRRTYRVFQFNKKSSSLILCPTLDCNFRCPYCFEEHQPGCMPPSVQTQVLAFIEQLLCGGIEALDVGWFGGEPLLFPNILCDMTARIAALCRTHGVPVKFSVTTNGYLITDELVEFFRQYSFEKIKITIDGSRAQHNARRFLANGGGTYDRIVQNVKALAARDVPVLVRVNIDHSNPDAYAQVLQEFRAVSGPVQIYPAIVTIAPTQSLQQLQHCYSHSEYDRFYQANRQQKHRKLPSYHQLFGHGVCSCVAEHESSFVIGPDGALYRCVNDVGNPCLATGTVVLGETQVESIAKYLGRDPCSEPECRDCPYLPLCYGGCVYEYKANGTHACPPVKSLFHQLIEQEIAP
ncbi:MAG: radical SAM protein [Faecalibacterium sp.]|nr:radical SAM protein [Faecalibacterium sp.]